MSNVKCPTLKKKVDFYGFLFCENKLEAETLGPPRYGVVSDSVLQGTMLIMNFSVHVTLKNWTTGPLDKNF